MITKELEQVYTEVNVILDNLSSDVLVRIPKEIKEYFKANASKEYIFKYDKEKKLIDQKIDKKTKGILACLYRDYICNESEKQEFNKKYKELLEEYEEEKIQFDPNNVFGNYKSQEYNIVNYKQESDKWYIKFFTFIKKILKK